MGITISVIGISAAWCAVREQLTRTGRWDLIVRVNPRDASAWKEWADHEKNQDRALERYAHSVEAAPENPYFHESLGMALEASHRPENCLLALKEYLKVMQLSPHRAFDALAIGRLLFLMGEPSHACEWFKNALRIEPRYWECDLWIARCLLRMGKPGKAVAILRHLQVRRDAYETWRKRMYEDLPWPNVSSGYDQAILSYDDSVVNRELFAIQNHR
jgi:tetratricopeptide (TPR) repeat protein